MALFWGRDFFFFSNDTFPTSLTASLNLGQPLIPHADNHWLFSLLKNVWNSETVEPYAYHTLDTSNAPLDYTLSFSPVINEEGEIVGVLLTAIESGKHTSTLLERNQQSQDYNRTVLDSVPAIIWTTEPDGSCSYLNAQWQEFTGQSQAQAEGFGWLDATHPDDKPLVRQAFFEANERHLPFGFLYRLRKYDGSYRWAIDRGSPRFDKKGNYLGMVGTVIDVHEQKLAEESLRASEAKLRSIVSTAPIAIGLFMGRDLVIENPNQTFIDIVGKGPDIVGKPLREVMPELISENQPFLQILDEVFTTGQRFHSYGSQVDIVQNGVMTHNIYNITYSPVFDEQGKVYAILDIAVDVTGEAKVKQALKESQRILQSMIDLAELGTYTIDLATDQLVKSPRVAEWYGLPEVTTVKDSLDQVAKNDQPLVDQAYQASLQEVAKDSYKIEYTVMHAKSGQKRILQTVGQVRRNLEGQPTHVDGLVRDMTAQREMQAALEQLVQERTEKLEAANEELHASNDQFAQMNEQLLRSNESLEQFAYIASHDLQEPLRKVQQFGSLLEKRHRDCLGEDARFVDGIQRSAQRMSLLIEDLLTFSKVSAGIRQKQSVSLSAVLAQALDTLSVFIEETKAEIRIEPLPTIRGDERQLEQLFQNLLSNALKFSAKDAKGTKVQPQIRITYQRIERHRLPVITEWKPLENHYHQINLEDNGIGFEEQYAERIFGVFQRLHGKNEFAGTGVGLAICQKVALNHGGFILAKGQLGLGATFCVYLPAS